MFLGVKLVELLLKYGLRGGAGFLLLHSSIPTQKTHCLQFFQHIYTQTLQNYPKLTSSPLSIPLETSPPMGEHRRQANGDAPTGAGERCEQLARVGRTRWWRTAVGGDSIFFNFFRSRAKSQPNIFQQVSNLQQELDSIGVGVWSPPKRDLQLSYELG